MCHDVLQLLQHITMYHKALTPIATLSSPYEIININKYIVLDVLHVSQCIITHQRNTNDYRGIGPPPPPPCPTECISHT